MKYTGIYIVAGKSFYVNSFCNQANSFATVFEILKLLSKVSEEI